MSELPGSASVRRHRQALFALAMVVTVALAAVDGAGRAPGIFHRPRPRLRSRPGRHVPRAPRHASLGGGDRHVRGRRHGLGTHRLRRSADRPSVARVPRARSRTRGGSATSSAASTWYATLPLPDDLRATIDAQWPAARRWRILRGAAGPDPQRGRAGRDLRPRPHRRPGLAVLRAQGSRGVQPQRGRRAAADVAPGRREHPRPAGSGRRPMGPRSASARRLGLRGHRDRPHDPDPRRLHRVRPVHARAGAHRRRLEWFPIIGPIVAASRPSSSACRSASRRPSPRRFSTRPSSRSKTTCSFPKVMGDAVELHPAVMILALVVGGSLFGIGGAILAAPRSPPAATCTDTGSSASVAGPVRRLRAAPAPGPSRSRHRGPGPTPRPPPDVAASRLTPADGLQPRETDLPGLERGLVAPHADRLEDPHAEQEADEAEPPYVTNGNGMPVTGMTPMTMPTLTGSWNTIIEARPTAIIIPNASRPAIR